MIMIKLCPPAFNCTEMMMMMTTTMTMMVIILVMMVMMVYSPQIEKDIVNARDVKWHSRCQHHHCLRWGDDDRDNDDQEDNDGDDNKEDDGSDHLSLPEIVNHWKHHEDCVIGCPCNQYSHRHHHNHKSNQNHRYYHWPSLQSILSSPSSSWW